jgi:hypothetical protein
MADTANETWSKKQNQLLLASADGKKYAGEQGSMVIGFQGRNGRN